MTEELDVAVVIPTTDLSKDSTRNALRSVENQSREADVVKVVVDSERRGPAWARNRGIEKVIDDADVIVFTDDDCVPPPMWIEEILDKISRGADIVGDGLAQIRENEYMDFLMERSRKSGERQVGGTGNIAYRSEVLRDVGGFDESFAIPGGEDHDLLERALDAGYTVECLGMRMPHDREMTREEYLSKIRDMAEADYQMFLKGERRLLAKHVVFLFGFPLMASYILGSAVKHGHVAKEFGFVLRRAAYFISRLVTGGGR